MDVCVSCDRILRTWSSDHWSPTGSVHNHVRVLRLLSSASSCRICNLIVSCPLELGEPDEEPVHGTHSTLRDYLSDPLLTIAETNQVKFWLDNSTADQGLSSVRVEVPTASRPLTIVTAAWAERDSPAALSSRVCTTPPIEADDSPMALELVKARIDDCIEYHEKCKFAISGTFIDEYEEPYLPKRVLEIQCGSVGTRVRLLATGEQRGHYAALSHCWGPSRKHPLCTTTANLANHIENLALDTLPKTFQDAVLVTQAAGLRYLWVDSLCIVQDDRADWLEASAVMGSIYERARLTIAASASADPTQGCFRSIRPAPQTIEVPYYSNIDTMRGSFYISAISQSDSSPYWGPLRSRAWALQEWRLSRRMMHFTRGGLSWKCKTLEVSERDVVEDFQEYPQWDSLVQEYTERKLTFETDRLIALQGLVTEMQKATDDCYHSGIWESDLPEILLWMVCTIKSDVNHLTTLPSWSWASQLGPKLFWSTQAYSLNDSHVSLCNMAADDGGIIRIRAPLKHCALSKTELDRDQLSGSEPLGHSPEIDMMIFRNKPVHYIQGVIGQSPDRVGLAALDDEWHADVACLFLASSPRSDSNPLRQPLQKAITAERPVQPRPRYEELENDELHLSEVLIEKIVANPDRSHHVHWVLLLRPAPGSPGRFRRVGMGIVWSEAWVPGPTSAVNLELV